MDQKSCLFLNVPGVRASERGGEHGGEHVRGPLPAISRSMWLAGQWCERAYCTQTCVPRLIVRWKIIFAYFSRNSKSWPFIYRIVIACVSRGDIMWHLIIRDSVYSCARSPSTSSPLSPISPESSSSSSLSPSLSASSHCAQKTCLLAISRVWSCVCVCMCFSLLLESALFLN